MLLNLTDLHKYQYVKDVPYIKGPAQKEFKERLAKKIKGKLQRKLVGKSKEMIVDQKQHLANRVRKLTVQHHLHSLQQVFVVECARNTAHILADDRKKAIDHLKGDLDCFWLIDVGLVE